MEGPQRLNDAVLIHKRGMAAQKKLGLVQTEAVKDNALIRSDARGLYVREE